MENKNNKGLITVLIIIIVVMFLTIVGLTISLRVQKYKCQLGNKAINTVTNTTDKISDIFGKVLDIAIKQSENGVKFPQIDYDSEDANEINKEIKDFIDSYTSGNDISFKVYDNNNIESVVLKKNVGGSTNKYIVHNINKNDGKRVTSEELLKTKNLTLDQLKEKMKSVWMEKVKTSEGYSMRIPSDYSTTVEQATKINIDKLTNDNVVLYLNDDGHLCVIYEEYQIAGAETGYYIIDIDTGSYTDLK